MATTTALGYALMCLLSRGPTTGYDLVRRLKLPIGYYWTAQQSQVYPELARLEESGLVRHVAEAGPGPRPRKTHELTATGQAALATWLATPPVPAASRNELLLKTYAVRAADHRDMRELYLAQAAAHEELLTVHRADLESLTDRGATTPAHPEFGNYANVTYGVAYEENVVRWCRWIAAHLADPLAPGESDG